MTSEFIAIFKAFTSPASTSTNKGWRGSPQALLAITGMPDASARRASRGSCTIYAGRTTAGVSVAFHYVESGINCGGVDEPRELAKPAAEIWHHAAGTQLAAFGKTFPARDAAELFPETEYFTRRGFDAIEMQAGGAEVLHFSHG